MIGQPTPPPTVVIHGDDPTHHVTMPGEVFARLMLATGLRFRAFNRDGTFVPSVHPVGGTARRLVDTFPELRSQHDSDLLNAAEGLCMIALLSRQVAWKAA